MWIVSATSPKITCTQMAFLHRINCIKLLHVSDGLLKLVPVESIIVLSEWVSLVKHKKEKKNIDSQIKIKPTQI